MYRQYGHPAVLALALFFLPLVSCPINNLPFVVGETVSDSRRDDESMLAASRGVGSFSVRKERQHPPKETVVPERGVFLVASPNIRDPRFHHSVILLLAHGQEGTLGLIINRPTEILLARVLPELKIPDQDSRAFFFGGPVGLDGLIFLMRSANPPQKATHVLADVYFSGDRKLLEKLLQQNKRSNELRVYLGHSGWLPGQLASEIGRGGWQLVRADANTVFEKDPDTIWRDLIKRPPAQMLAGGSSPEISLSRLF